MNPVCWGAPCDRPGATIRQPGDCLAGILPRQAAEKLRRAVIPRSRRRRPVARLRARALRWARPEDFGPQGEESRIALKTLRARFLAPLGMTAWWGLSPACRGKILDLRDSVSPVAPQFACSCVWRDYNDAREARFMSRVSSPENLVAQLRH